MTNEFEYMSYEDDDRIATLEHKAAELDRLMASIPRGREPRWAGVAAPDPGYPVGDYADGDYPDGGYPDSDFGDDASLPGDGYPEQGPANAGPVPLGRPRAGAARGPAAPGRAGPGGGRTEALINHGRQRARRSRLRTILGHWRLLAVAAAALTAGLIAALVATGGSGPGWPASVLTVQAEIKQACQNPDTAAEPSGLNFACAKDTQSVLWVYSLLTSGNNASYVDQATGRTGLEPITPAQGGDIAWSLNLHHPYDAADPVDSLQVAARAINNIISGATLTSSTGRPRSSRAWRARRPTASATPGRRSWSPGPGYPAHCGPRPAGRARPRW